MREHLGVFTSPAGQARALRAYDAVLDRWPVPCQEIDVPTSFGSTHVIAGGAEDGPPLVLLHAFFATAMSWYRVAGPLSARHRVLAVDVLGEANRSRPLRPVASVDESARWFAEVADGLGLDGFSLVGNSFGGFLAAEYSRRMTDRVEALVLIGPAATFTGMPAFYLHTFLPKAAYLFLPWLPAQARAMRRSERWLLAGLPGDPAWDALFHEVLMHGTSRTRFFPRVFTAPELAEITAPTLLLIGDHDRIYRPERAATRAQELMPGIEVAIVPDAHHLTALAQPERVAELVSDFVARAGGPR